MNQLLVNAFISELEKLSSLTKQVAGQPGGSFVDINKEVTKGIPKVQGAPTLPVTNLTKKPKAMKQQPIAASSVPSVDVPITETVQASLSTASNMNDQDAYQKDLKSSLIGRPSRNTSTIKGVPSQTATAGGNSTAAVNSAASGSSKGAKA